METINFATEDYINRLITQIKNERIKLRDLKAELKENSGRPRICYQLNAQITNQRDKINTLKERLELKVEEYNKTHKKNPIILDKPKATSNKRVVKSKVDENGKKHIYIVKSKSNNDEKTSGKVNIYSLDFNRLINTINNIKDCELIQYLEKCDNTIKEFMGCNNDDHLIENYSIYSSIYDKFYKQSGLKSYLKSDKEYVLENLRNDEFNTLAKYISEEI